MREKMKKVERENVEFRQRGYRNSFAQFCCPGVRGVRGEPKVKKKKKIVTIVTIAFPKMGKKNVVPKSRESKKKKVLCSQYFHNKSHVISYY